ncbi:nitronate monooxygenase family protein [Agromyces sp. Marseille-P2726]|uniref:NAD(P)H-dependent flavin oxidoreductase n=1 Tax=Agromyces sp. Marseille-P2726 TaxID=2709132 RepID=UPI0020C2A375|nr:nitronate monooxygenase [Agromyces sp. Marseille-P2726]
MSEHDVAERLTTALGIRHPIVLGPFGGLSSVELTAAVSELGGLGSYGLYGYDAARIAETATELRAATRRPFALNLWLPLEMDGEGFDTRRPTGGATRPPAKPASFDDAVSALRGFFEELDLPVPTPPERYLPSFDEQWSAVLQAQPAVASFVFGVPPAEVVASARERGILLVGTATSVDEAIALQAGGVDAIVATGLEAAGHRVSFLRPAESALVGSISLIPQVVDAVDVPVIAGGGIADRRGVAAAFALGASAVQVGTAFLRTRQSAANDAHRNAIASTPAHDTVLTRAMSGRLSRGAANRAVRSIEQGGAIAPFPVQNWLTGRFRIEAGRRNLGELQSLWLGQSAPLAVHDEASDVFAELVAGVPA